jgi:hypothetical protein
VDYVELAAGFENSSARRSDGVLVAWGFFAGVATPPFGHAYVEVAAGFGHVIARRSDGVVVAWFRNFEGQCNVPSPPAGLGYLDVAAKEHRTAVVLGPVSSYVGFGSGCAGSMPVTRLVPGDTPRIGELLTVLINNLPADAAFVITGFSNTSSVLGPLPLDLTNLGMPGCSLRTSAESTLLVLGGGNRAGMELLLPFAGSLIGLRFFQQAAVLDAPANAAGIVASDAIEAIVGR